MRRCFRLFAIRGVITEMLSCPVLCFSYKNSSMCHGRRRVTCHWTAINAIVLHEHIKLPPCKITLSYILPINISPITQCTRKIIRY
jgi:hypothetical protein